MPGIEAVGASATMRQLRYINALRTLCVYASTLRVCSMRLATVCRQRHVTSVSRRRNIRGATCSSAGFGTEPTATEPSRGKVIELFRSMSHCDVERQASRCDPTITTWENLPLFEKRGLADKLQQSLIYHTELKWERVVNFIGML